MQISVSKQIHADLAHQHGFLGEGIGIAYLDTGLFPHKDFSPHSTRVAKFVDFVHSKSFSYDDNGHGTHITGIAASSATFGSDYLGIAPKSHIVSLKVLDASGNGVQSAFLQGLDWIHEYHRYHPFACFSLVAVLHGRKGFIPTVTPAPDWGAVTLLR